MNKKLLIIAGLAFLQACASHPVKTDPYDGAKIIEHKISGQDAGDGSILHYLAATYKKKIHTDGRSSLKTSIHLIGNTYRTMKIEPVVTFKIDGKEFELPIKDESSTIDQTLKVNKNSEVVDKGIAFLNVYGEIDLQSIKDKLLQAKDIKIRFKRGGDSAVFGYTETQLAGLRELINHNGAE